MRKEEREEERELEPQATPRVFWVVFFFLLVLLLPLLVFVEGFEEIELKLLFDLEPEFVERDESKLIFG